LSDLLALLDLAAIWSAVWPALLIALLRMTDVCLNVFRTVFVVQERRTLAALVAGLEAGTWLGAAGIVFADVTPMRAAGFVAGVALGTAIGVELTRRLQLGMATVRIYADADAVDADGLELAPGRAIARAIHQAGFGATVFRGTGYEGPVDMILSTVRRRDAQKVLRIARSVDPSAFAAVDNVPAVPTAATATAGRV
jgi:uncharacterized protein YebE (UPF0316 family)